MAGKDRLEERTLWISINHLLADYTIERAVSKLSATSNPVGPQPHPPRVDSYPLLVQKVIDARVLPNGVQQYRVKWVTENAPKDAMQDDVWVDEADMRSCARLVQHFMVHVLFRRLPMSMPW